MTNVSSPLQISFGVGKFFPKLDPPQELFSPVGAAARMALTPGRKGGPGGVCTAMPLLEGSGEDGGQFSGGSLPYICRVSQKDDFRRFPYSSSSDIFLSEFFPVTLVFTLPISKKLPWRGAILYGRK
nr:hypothetical protein Itr_chr08CG02640 [Ipomoea trifida]GMD23175.1 hypothetical protein Iba_chr08bCG2750 [Ipomoea batatas]